MIKTKKSQAEYAWLFSIVIGAMIIFLAIFFAGKIFKTGTYLTETEILRSFDIILNPFSSVGSIASLTLSRPIEMPFYTEMTIECSALEESEKLSLRQVEKGRTGDWASYTIKNKYLFANSTVRGIKFWTFSKPFEMPWRVDDLIYLISENYCFINAPANVDKELRMINASAVHAVKYYTECNDGEKKVCFSGNFADCNILVNYQNNQVTKKGKASINFASDSLMYAAVFSDNENYNCNLQRLMKRLSSQAEIYFWHAKQLNQDGCDNDQLVLNLNQFKTALASSQVSSDPSFLINLASQVGNSDSYNCPIIK